MNVVTCRFHTLQVREGFELLEWLWSQSEHIAAEVSVNPSEGRHSHFPQRPLALHD